MSLSRAPARDTSETPSPRERIRSHMKMVISQLEGILIELKDVAKELREVRSFYIVFFIFLRGGVGGLVGGAFERATGGQGGDGNRGRLLVPAGSASPLGYI